MSTIVRSSERIGVAILGATGFGGGELLRLLSMHPNVTVSAVQSRSNSGVSVGELHPHLRGVYKNSFVSEITNELDGYEKSVIFSSLPHGESGAVVAQHRQRFPTSMIIDLSGDLRLRNKQAHEEYYAKFPFNTELRNTTVYGLPEKNRAAIKNTTLVANPGCLATAAILSILPLLDSTIHLQNIALHLATGSSGAGKELKSSTHHPVRHANFYAYKPLEHQHLPEIIESLTNNDSANTAAVKSMSFVPHSLPVSRGILCSAFITTSAAVNLEQVKATYQTFYASHPFIRMLTNTAAELENVVGSNFADIAIHAKDNHLIIHVAIDNLVKGMAGQAIHNMNLMCGLPETTGLFFGGLRPV